MDINSKYKRILIDLFSSPRGLFAYTLYSRYGITPSEAVAFVDEYQKSGIIQVDSSYRIVLTKEGHNQILSITNSFETDSSGEISYLGRYMTEQGIGINEPFLPDELFYIKYRAREADITSQ